MHSYTRRYIFAFVIATAIFGTALVLSTMFNNARVAQVQTIEDTIATDILSSETQFELLSELSCKEVHENSVLSQELADVSRRVAYTEEKLGAENEQVLRLKRQYTLLQIKDLLLMQRVSQKCGLKPVFVLYFYSNQNDCADCEREGYALTALSEQYPQLRVYSFDYHLDLPALKTLMTIYDINGNLPTLVINSKPYYGFKSMNDLVALMPQIKTLATATSTKTTK